MAIRAPDGAKNQIKGWLATILRMKEDLCLSIMVSGRLPDPGVWDQMQAILRRDASQLSRYAQAWEGGQIRVQ